MQSNAPPNSIPIRVRARVYRRNGVISAKALNEFVHIKNLLQLKGIAEYEIEVQELDDFDARTVASQLPVVDVEGVRIGTVSDLESWIISGRMSTLLHEEIDPAQSYAAFEQRLSDVRNHKQLLQDELEKAQQHAQKEAIEELQCSLVQLDQSIASISSLLRQMPKEPVPAKSSPAEPSSVRLAVEPYALVASAYETGASLLSGVGSVLSSYFPWRPAARQQRPGSRKSEEPLSEFDVIQINWYWRQQPRKLRFFADKFQRVSPTGDVRAEHSYAAVQHITLTGHTFLQITFSDASPTEYYQSSIAERIVKLIVDVAISAPNFCSIPVVRVNE